MYGMPRLFPLVLFVPLLAACAVNRAIVIDEAALSRDRPFLPGGRELQFERVEADGTVLLRAADGRLYTCPVGQKVAVGQDARVEVLAADPNLQTARVRVEQEHETRAVAPW